MMTIDIPDYLQREEAVKLYEAWCKAENARCDAQEQSSDKDYSDLEKAENDAWAAYQAHGRNLQTEGYDGIIVRCGLSGVPLYVDDEVLEDTHTGEMFLRLACGVKLREVEEEKELLPEAVE